VARVTFIVPTENRILQVSNSRLRNRTVANMQQPPEIGFEMIEEQTGVKYKVIRVKDVRRRRLRATPFVDFIAELDRV
jgi:hypothetical protein